MKNLKNLLLDVVFPPRCAVCGEILRMEERQEFLCADCLSDVPYLPREKCPHCGGETENGGFCDFCMKHFPFDSVCGAFPYEKVRDAIHLFKYDGDKTIGNGLGELMADYLMQYHEELLVKTDVMVSVPLHEKKEKKAKKHFSSVFESVGINQTKHSIYLNVIADISIVMPSRTENFAWRESGKPSPKANWIQRKEN